MDNGYSHFDRRTAQRRDLERRDGLTRHAVERRAAVLDQGYQDQETERRAEARRMRVRRAIDQAVSARLAEDVTEWQARWREARRMKGLSHG